MYGLQEILIHFFQIVLIQNKDYLKELEQLKNNISINFHQELLLKIYMFGKQKRFRFIKLCLNRLFSANVSFILTICIKAYFHEEYTNVIQETFVYYKYYKFLNHNSQGSCF